MIVVDSSAAVDYLARLDPGDWVGQQISEAPILHAPHIVDVEVVSGLRRLVAAGVLPESTATEALERLAELRIIRYPHLPLVDRMWELRATVSAADAAFVALAEWLEADLLTTDSRLARAPGIRATVLAP